MMVLYIILAVFALLLLVLMVNTALKCVKARKLVPYKAEYTEEELNHYASRLAKMIRCKTVSVKGSYDDTEFKKLREVTAQLFPEIHKTAEIKIFSEDCWIYKIKGRDAGRNIMLMSHHDVVAADDKWDTDPFGAEMKDGKMWGRGTVDTKTPLFAEFSALEELLAEGYMPPCNVYIGSSHNEELGGDGIPTALKYFQENNIQAKTLRQKLCLQKCMILNAVQWAI